MNLLVSTVCGGLIGAILALVVSGRDGTGGFAAVGAVGALLAGIILSGLMFNRPFASGAVSLAAIARSLGGSAFLLALFLLLQPRHARRRTVRHRTKRAQRGTR